MATQMVCGVPKGCSATEAVQGVVTLLGLVTLLVGAFLGGSFYGQYAERKEAAKAGVAYWMFDAATGCSRFVYSMSPPR